MGAAWERHATCESPFIESSYLTVAGCHFLPGRVLPNGMVMAGSGEQPVKWEQKFNFLCGLSLYVGVCQEDNIYLYSKDSNLIYRIYKVTF
jgi:hypothetical protein